MNPVKSHYDQHLGQFYSWMVGDFKVKSEEQKQFFQKNNLKPFYNQMAFDLGCGHGLQTLALAQLGYSVKAIDFNNNLLDELRAKADKHVEVIEDNLIHFDRYASQLSELIVCMGDTLTHLASMDEVEELVKKVQTNLVKGGKLVLSFRDLSIPLGGTDRFIPLKSDDTRIHTCFLEYFETHVQVYDLLHEKQNDKWVQKVSSYPKLILTPSLLYSYLESADLQLLHQEEINRVIYLIAEKK